ARGWGGAVDARAAGGAGGGGRPARRGDGVTPGAGDVERVRGRTWPRPVGVGDRLAQRPRARVVGVRDREGRGGGAAGDGESGEEQEQTGRNDGPTAHGTSSGKA